MRRQGNIALEKVFCMNVEILKDEKDYVEIKLNGEDLGMVNLIAHELVSTGAATFAAASLDHPITANPVLRVRGKDPKKEIAKSAERLAKKLSELSASGKKRKA